MAESIAKQLDGSRTRMESRTEAKLRRGMAKAWQDRHAEAACIRTGLCGRWMAFARLAMGVFARMEAGK